MAIERTIPNIKAQKKPLTIKPGTKLLTKRINKAFMIKVKRPNVSMFMGRVSNMSIGFKNAFIIPKTKAATKAVVKLEI